MTSFETTESTTIESKTTEPNDDLTHQEGKNEKDEKVTMGNHENSSFEGDTNEESLSQEEDEEDDVTDKVETNTIKHTVTENVSSNELAESSTTDANNVAFEKEKTNSDVETDVEDIEEDYDESEESQITATTKIYEEHHTTTKTESSNALHTLATEKTFESSGELFLQ